MAALLLVLLLIIILGAAGFALKLLWIIALIVLAVWLIRLRRPRCRRRPLVQVVSCGV